MWGNKNINKDEDVVTTYLKKPGTIVLMDGRWGAGKTYRFEEIIKKQLERDKFKVKYISLFGLKNTEQLKSEIYKRYLESKYNLSSLWFWFWICFICLGLILFNYSLYGYLICEYKDLISVFFHLNQFSAAIPVIVFLLEAVILYEVLCSFGLVVSHFYNKFCGLNYQNIPIRDMFDADKTIFCFDDFERVAAGASVDEFLGFVNTLAKTDGFSVLVLSCYESCSEQDDHKKLMTLYKEKIFDYQVQVEISEDKIKSVYNEYPDLVDDEELLNYLIEVYAELRKSRIDLGNNLRTLRKICRNLAEVSLIIDGFGRLKQNCTDKVSVWAYIAYLTIAIDKNEKILCYDGIRKNYQKAETDLEVIEMALMEKSAFAIDSVKYESIFNLLKFGWRNEELMRKELLPFDSGCCTEFEKKYLPLINVYEPQKMEREDRNKLKKQVEKDFRVRTPMFSSIANMRKIIQWYHKFYQATFNCLAPKDYDKLIRIITANVKLFDIQELKSGIKDDTYRVLLHAEGNLKQYSDIMNYIMKCCKQQLIEKMKDCWQDELKAEDEEFRIYALLSVCLYPEKLFQLYTADFQEFKNIVLQIWLCAGIFVRRLRLEDDNKEWLEKFNEFKSHLLELFHEKLRSLPKDEIAERQSLKKYIRELNELKV